MSFKPGNIYKFGKLDVQVDLSKWSKVSINLRCVYRRGYSYLDEEQDKFLEYIKKKIKPIVSQYFNNIVVVEPNATRKKDNEPSIDITLKLKEPMTTIEKRAYVHQPDGPIYEMINIVKAKIDEAFEEYDNADYRRKIRCGEYYYTTKQLGDEKIHLHSDSSTDDAYDD